MRSMKRFSRRESGLDFLTAAELGRVGRERLQFPAELGDVLGLDAPQIDVQPVTVGSERQAGEDLVDGQQAGLDLLDGFLVRAVQR